MLTPPIQGTEPVKDCPSMDLVVAANADPAFRQTVTMLKSGLGSMRYGSFQFSVQNCNLGIFRAEGDESS